VKSINPLWETIKAMCVGYATAFVLVMLLLMIIVCVKWIL